MEAAVTDAAAAAAANDDRQTDMSNLYEAIVKELSPVDKNALRDVIQGK